MSETIFVSGASGRVGQPLVKALIKEGATVRVHARRAEAAESLKSLGAHVFDGDLAQLPSRAFDGVSTLYHLAGGVRKPCWSASLTRYRWSWRAQVPFTAIVRTSG